jgi:hypothetical protein
LADFAEDIGSIAGSKGLSLKRQTPLKNLQAFCNKLADSSEQLETKLVEVRNELQVARQDLKVKTDEVLSKLRKSLPGKIEAYADQYVMDNPAFLNACSDLLDNEFRSFASDLCGSVGQTFDDIEIDEQAVSPVARDIPQFQKRVEKIKYDSRRNEAFGKAGGVGLGGWGGAEGGAILGTMLFPGVGTVIGGLIGGVVGAWAGSKAGGAAGGYFNTTEEIEVSVGDNRDEVSLETREGLLEFAETRLNVLYQQLDKLCFIDIAEWLQNFERALVSLRQNALTHSQEIQKELIHGPA